MKKKDNEPPAGCTLEAYAKLKNIAQDFLSEQGITQITYQSQPALRIPYFDARHEEAAIRYRIALTGDNKFRWQKGAKLMPYGLWRLKEARNAGYIIIVEGESDCHTLWIHGFPTLGIPGAASWREQWEKFLDGIPILYVLIEPDAGGDAVLKWVSESRINNRIRLISMEDL